MNNVFDYLIISIALLNVGIFISFILLRKTIIRLFESFTDLFLARMTLDRFNKNIETEDSQVSDEDIHTENFIKFLSDSRDWAFNYIEQSMETISDIIKHCEHELSKKDLSHENYLSYAHIISRLGTLVEEQGQSR